MSGTILGAALALAAALLAGCVTEQSQVFTTEASPQAALDARLQLVRGYIGERNWDAAKRNLRLAADIDPNAPEVHEAFALVHQGAGEVQQAERRFKRALAARRGFSRARNNYAAFLYAQGRYREAARQLEVVVRDTLYESRLQAFVNLGLCRARLDDAEGARRAFTRALALDANAPLALLELAHVEFGAGNWHDSARHLSAYREQVRQPSSRALWLGLRLAHARGDEGAQASAALALRNLYPQSAEYRAYERALQHGEI